MGLSPSKNGILLAILVMLIALAVILTPYGSNRFDDLKTRHLLTSGDLKAYYGKVFKIEKETTAGDLYAHPVSYETSITYVSNDDEPHQYIVSLSLEEKPATLTARECLEVQRKTRLSHSFKSEEVADVGDYAVWSDKSLGFAAGQLAFELSATGLKDQDDQTESRTAAVALAKKILERLK